MTYYVLNKAYSKLIPQYNYPENEVTTQKTAQKIVSAILANPAITRKELSALCGISDDGIKWQLKKLQDKNLIRRVGPDKGGHWEIIKNGANKNRTYSLK